MVIHKTRYRKPELKLQPAGESLMADGEHAADSEARNCENIQVDFNTLSRESQPTTDKILQSNGSKNNSKQEAPPVLNQPGKIKRVKRVSFSEEIEEFYTTAFEGELSDVKFSKSLLSSTSKAVHPIEKKSRIQKLLEEQTP